MVDETKFANDKIILTDVDGVLLNWIDSFHKWMRQRSYKKIHPRHYDIQNIYEIDVKLANQLINEFNHSNSMKNLRPIKDSVKHVRKLYKYHGFKFHCITAIPNDNVSVSMRRKNLFSVFGEDVFYKIDCVGDSKNKYDILSKYIGSGMVWIEDHYDNAAMGRDLGLNSYLINHEYNIQYKDNTIKRVDSWKKLYDSITPK